MPLDSLLPSLATSSPITRLPSELLSEIFSHCIPSTPFPTPSPTHGPLLPAQVNVHWRAVSLSTPTLWSRLHLTYKDSSSDVPLAALWLSRSGGAPLSFALTLDFGESPKQEILDVFLAHAERWERVRMEFSELYCPPVYSLAGAEGRTGMLKCFEFHARDVAPGNVVPVTQLLEGAPRLKEVAWADDIADMGALLGLPLERLTRLSIAVDRGQLDYLALLERCSRLEWLGIARAGAEGVFGDTKRPVALPYLTRLEVAYDVAGVLDWLVLPALTHVRVHAEYEKEYFGVRGGWSGRALMGLVERSGSVLESLWVNAPMEERDLVECLRKAGGSLERLGIVGIGISDALLSVLTPAEDGIWENGHGIGMEIGGCLCPRLEEIEMDTRIVSAPGDVMDMVEARMAGRVSGVEKLSTVRILDGHKDIRGLKQLSGLKLEIIPRKDKTLGVFYRRPRTRRTVCTPSR